MADSTAQPKRRNWRTGAAVVVVAILMLLMLLFIYDSIGASALNKAVLQARAIGGPLTLDELRAARTPCPDDENGALVILSIKPALDGISDILRNTADLGAPKLPVFSDEYTELGRQWRPDTAAAVADFLGGLQDELAAIDTLKGYAGGEFPINFAPNPMDTLLPHLSSLRASVRLKSLQVLDRVMGGDVGRLADDVKVLTRQASLLEGEPVFISSLVAVACEALVTSTIEQACALAEIDSDQLARIQQLLEIHDVEARIRSSIGYERAGFIGAGDHFRRTGNSGMLGPGFAAPPALLRMPGAKGLLMRDQARGIELYNRLLAQPDPAGILSEARAVEAEVAVGSQLDVLTRTFMPSFGRAIQLACRGAAEKRSARVAMAAERYRLAYGRWPASLEQLVPEYIEAIPEDPFSPGKPLRMSAQDDRLVIYSLGLDEDDDGGDLRRGPGVNIEVGDLGFILLNPEQRNRPPLPESQPVATAPE